jgi:Ca2+-dependent lipid-binding protein
MVDQMFNLVAIFVSARGLKDLSRLGTSDPVCIVSEYNRKAKEWTHLYQTEIKKNELNPDWSAFETKYFFERQQKLKFEIFDSTKDKPDLDKCMGRVETSMGKLMGARK